MPWNMQAGKEVSKLEMSIPHDLTMEEALKRVKTLLPEMNSGEFAGKITDLTESWMENAGNFSFKASGIKISGSMTVIAGSVELLAAIPFPASLAMGKIEKAIKDRSEKLLA